MEDIFDASEDVKKKLKINKKTKYNMTEEILEIFRKAEKEYNKTRLNVQEITLAYYNLFTAHGAPLRDKKAISSKLFMMKGQTKNNGRIIMNDDGTYSLNPDFSK